MPRSIFTVGVFVWFTDRKENKNKKQKSWCSVVYLKQSGFSGHNQYVWVAVVLSNSEQLFGGRGWSELEGCAGPSDITSMSHIAELVKFPVGFRNIITYSRNKNNPKLTFNIKSINWSHVTNLQHVLEHIIYKCWHCKQLIVTHRYLIGLPHSSVVSVSLRQGE